MYSLEAHIVDCCNLNCKSCTHFCPLVPTYQGYKDLDALIDDLLRLNAIRCTPNEFKILGGEPLMHGKLTDYLYKFRGALPNSRILIWTNGLLLPKMPQAFFNNCEIYNIEVVITPYPPSRNNPEIQRIVNTYRFVNFDSYFQDEFWASPLVSASNAGSSIDGYNRCRIKTGRCNILEDGKIYQCALPAFIHYLNNKLPFDQERYIVSEDDYVDIWEIWNEKDLIEKLYQPTPFCRYCINEKGLNHTWCHAIKDPKEWIDM